MTSGSLPDRSSWRGSSPAFRPPAPTARGPAWRSSPSPANYRPRWLKLAAVAAALIACLVAVSYTVLWLSPPPPVRLVVLEAGYETNLTVPPNATGKNAGRNLLTMAQTGANGWFASRGQLRATPEPVRLTRGANLLPDLDRVKEPTVVLFVAAHGGRDADGAFLFPDDTTPDPAHRVRLKAVIDRLAKLPKKTNKLLILDATQPPSYPDLGLFHNDFADALEQLDADIAAVPNLVVVSSAGTDERSWVAPEWGETTFSRILIEGYQGASDANDDERVTAWELFDYVRPRTHDWARDHRGALQTPVLLPKADGERRARSILVASVDRDAKTPPAAAPTPFQPPAELEQLWQDYRTLGSAVPPPESYAPHVWREYEAWILRYESLLFNGTPDAAEEVRAKVADARRRMEALRKLPVSPQTLALPFGVGGVSGSQTVPTAVLDGIARLAATPDADRAKLWAQLRTSLTDREPEAARLLWCAGTLQWVAVDPATRLAAAPALVALVTEGMTVRPSELHLLTMLAENVPAFAKSDALGPLLGQLLHVRKTAEAITGGDFEAGYVLPWTTSAMQKGDARRRGAEDLAFATTPAFWKDATGTAGQAKADYADAKARADRVHAVVNAWQANAAKLPSLAGWVTYLPTSGPANRRQEQDEELQTTRSLWESIHTLAKFADAGKDIRDEDLPSADQTAAAANAKFALLEKRLAAEIERLITTRPEFDAKRETRAELVAWWQTAAAAFSAPLTSPVEPSRRLRLALELRHVSRQLLITGVTQPQALPEVSVATTKERAFQTARWLGLLELARLGRAAFSGPDPQANVYDQLTFRLNNFALQADGRQTLADVGGTIGQVLDANPMPPAKPETPPTRDELRLADRRVRLMPAAATVTLGAGPTDALRRQMAADVLLAQAERTYVDHWYGGTVPYFRVAVDHLLGDVRKITGRDLPAPAKATWASRLEKPTAFPLTPVVPQKLWLTDEPNLTVTYPLQRAPNDPAGPGFAVFWQEPPFRAVANAALPREVRATGLPVSAAPAEPVTATLTPPAGPKPEAPTAVVGVGRLQGFFRGRLATSNAAVNYSPTPDHAAIKLPFPAAATLAVRADPALQAKFGTATGSVAIVLDCTGSMRPPKDAEPGENGRYLPALEVTEKLLRGLPAGTNVTVWTFGQRTPDAASPDDTIRVQLPRTVWTRDNSAVIEPLMASLRGLEPWDESSVMYAVLRARDGLLASPGSFKAVVLVSDAVDNRFAQDPVANPRKESIKDALRTRLADTGVRIGVVAIPVTDKTEAAAQLEFKTVETLQPPGKYLPPPQADAMLAWLRSGLNPRIRFSVSPVATESLSPPSFDLSAGDEGADVWYPGRLPPGTYEMRVAADREHRFSLALQRGDRLLVRLREDFGSLSASRVWYAAEAPALARTPEGGKAGRMSLLQNQALDGNALRLLVAIEDRPVNVPPVAADHIGDVWYELTPTVPKPPPVAVRFGTEPGYPAPCWTLDVRGWPTLPDGKTLGGQTLEAWWHPDAPFPAAVRWEAAADDKILSTPPTRLPVNDNVVSLDSIRLEDHSVTVAPGQTALKKCLVVRLSHSVGKPVWARLAGLNATGSEVRVFRNANKVTCLFWWAGDAPTDGSINNSLRGLEVVSLSDFRREATAAGRYLKLADAPPPSPASARPQPPADVK